MDGFATGLSLAIVKDGQQVTTARIPFALGTSAMAGSVSSVSYGIQNDLNTGMYSPGADQIALACGGIQALGATATVVSVPVTLQSDAVQKVAGTPYDAFPSGTALLFMQTSAPTGWTKSTTHNDKALRIVSGTASSGGTVAFSTCFSRTSTDSYTLQTADVPSHTHTATASGTHNHGIQVGNAVAGGVTGVVAAATGLIGTDNTAIQSSSSGAGISVSNASSGGGGGHSHTMDIRVQFADVIAATKN